MLTIIMTSLGTIMLLVIIFACASIRWIRRSFRITTASRNRFNFPHPEPMTNHQAKYVLRTVQTNANPEWERRYEALLQHMISHGDLVEAWGFRTSLVVQGRTNKSQWSDLFIYKLPPDMSAAEFTALEQTYVNDGEPCMTEQLRSHSRIVSAHLIPSCVIGDESNLPPECAFYVEYISVQPDAIQNYTHSMDEITAPAMSMLSKQGAIHSFTVFEMDVADTNGTTTTAHKRWNQIHITAGSPLSFIPFSSRFNRAIKTVQPQVGGLEGAIKQWEQWCSYEWVDVMKLLWHYRISKQTE
ncbi:hypothetical protein [Paenibacillus alvei]|uniref:Uncharacterized protein n=1 Tax=Paenibacillus alvei TaxID=44250 RepID=A0A383RBD8_PAEAL|nr:hypothetical protein [Paenibacillus alvei]SYX84278.1 conserved protein of unknown function [Paenibacillus alvei]